MNFRKMLELATAGMTAEQKEKYAQKVLIELVVDELERDDSIYVMLEKSDVRDILEVCYDRAKEDCLPFG